MRVNRVRELLDEGTVVVNGWLSVDSSYQAEVLSHAGFDTVTVDLQHGMYGLDTAVSLLQGISAGPAVPMARCPDQNPATVGKLLDAGAYGIICPGIDTPAQAAALVIACRYPPAGRRSFGPARALLYGGPDYVARSNDTVLVWAMIESAEALANLDAILAVPGLDGVYVGPNDLALSLGQVPGQNPSPTVVTAAVARVVAAARAAEVWTGIFCPDGVAAQQMAAAGFDLVTPGNDVGTLRVACADRIAMSRGAARQLSSTEGGGRGSAGDDGY